MRKITILFFSTLLASCASAVNFDFDKFTDFNTFSNYQIINIPVRVTKDTRINSPLILKRVVDELNAALHKKGLNYSKEHADLKIKYYLDVKREIEAESSSVLSFGFGTLGHHSSLGLGFNVPIGEISSVDKLVLTIDIVSSKTKKLVWRGSLGAYLYEGITPEDYTRTIKNLVTEILNHFPPK